MTPPAPNNQCYGSDWILNGSKCLLFRPNDFKTYLDATLECQLHHASLVSIHSIYQNQFLLQTIKAKYSVQIESIWVGLHKSSTCKQLQIMFFVWYLWISFIGQWFAILIYH